MTLAATCEQCGARIEIEDNDNDLAYEEPGEEEEWRKEQVLCENCCSIPKSM